MSGTAGWDRRLRKLEAGLPHPPAGARYWLELFAGLGERDGLARREPDFAGLVRAYRALRPPYGEEADRLHGHLAELTRRWLGGVPPCSAAEFAGLAAWLAEHGAALPTVNGWKQDLEVGDGTTATLSDLTWRVSRGPTAGGSGGVAETIRRLKARREGRPPPPEPCAGRRAATPLWVPSVVRDDTNGDAPGDP